MKEMWNRRYSEVGFAYGTSPNDFLVEQLKTLKSKGRVLCIAEGEGRNALYLARQGFRVTAVDFSEVAIRKLQERAFEEKLEIHSVVAHLEHFDMGQAQWDAVVSIFAHMPSQVRKIVHRNIQNGLVKDGIMLIEAYTPLQIPRGTGGPKDPDMMLNLSVIHDELPELTPVFERELEREIHEGKYHFGTSSVVQFVGRK